MIDVYDQPNPDVEVRYEVPSKLPELLRQREVQAILVSSIETLRRPNAIVAGSIGIISQGEVESVKLFSKVPFGSIKTLALDSSSMTSNCLAQILLAEMYDIVPAVLTLLPVQDSMFAQADACVLIGDIGMTAPTDGLHVMDLRRAWLDLTGLPFIWALWLLLEPDAILVEKLEQPLIESGFPPLAIFHTGDTKGSGLATDPSVARRILAMAEIRKPLLQKTSARFGWPLETVTRYLEDTIGYWVREDEWDGLMKFGELLAKHKLVHAWQEPTRVFANPGAIPVSDDDQRLMKIFRRGSDPAKI